MHLIVNFQQMIYYWLLLVIRCDGLHIAASTGGQQLSVVSFDNKSSFFSGKVIRTGDQLQRWAVCYIGDPVRFPLIIAGVCILGCQVFIPVPRYLPSLNWAEWLAYGRPVVCPAYWQVILRENNLCVLVLIWNTTTQPPLKCPAPSGNIDIYGIYFYYSIEKKLEMVQHLINS